MAARRRLRGRFAAAAAAVLALGIGSALLWRATPRPDPPAAAAPAEPAPDPAALDDESLAPLASADLRLLIDAGDDHALLEELELFLWLEDRRPHED